MSKYAGTKTEANLRAAFAGESQARNQYTFFASVAKKEGYEQMAALFLKTVGERAGARQAVAASELCGHRRHDGREPGRCRRRARTSSGRTCIDGLRQDCRGRGLPGAGRAASAWSAAIEKHHEERYRALLHNRGDRAGVRKERGQGVGMPQLRPHRSSAQRPPTSAPPAVTRRAILNSAKKIIEIESTRGR